MNEFHAICGRQDLTYDLRYSRQDKANIVMTLAMYGDGKAISFRDDRNNTALIVELTPNGIVDFGRSATESCRIDAALKRYNNKRARQ